MKKPIIEENTLENEHLTATIWQQVEDGVAEQAIHARTWDGGDNAKLIELKQENGSVLLNGETIRELSKMLIRWIG
jgi:hypothetical protein